MPVWLKPGTMDTIIGQAGVFLRAPSPFRASLKLLMNGDTGGQDTMARRELPP